MNGGDNDSKDEDGDGCDGGNRTFVVHDTDSVKDGGGYGKLTSSLIKPVIVIVVTVVVTGTYRCVLDNVRCILGMLEAFFRSYTKQCVTYSNSNL